MSTRPFLVTPEFDFLPSHIRDTLRLTFCLSAPEPAGAAVPAPPNAASAQTVTPEAPKEAETKPVDAPATATEMAAPPKVAEPKMPEIPAAKPAAGMSATSGPLNDDPFSAEPKKEEAAAPVPTPAAPAAATTTAPPA